LQASEAGGDEAFAPQSDGVSIAVQLGGDILVGRLVLLGSLEDEATAEGECLRCGTGLDQRSESSAVVVGEHDG